MSNKFLSWPKDLGQKFLQGFAILSFFSTGKVLATLIFYYLDDNTNSHENAEREAITTGLLCLFGGWLGLFVHKKINQKLFQKPRSKSFHRLLPWFLGLIYFLLFAVVNGINQNLTN